MRLQSRGFLIAHLLLCDKELLLQYFALRDEIENVRLQAKISEGKKVWLAISTEHSIPTIEDNQRKKDHLKVGSK